MLKLKTHSGFNDLFLNHNIQKKFTINFLKQNATPKLLWIRLISLLPIFLELMKYEVFMKRKLK
jgi:hypothetical protein